MKRLLFIFTLLFAFAICNSQMIGRYPMSSVTASVAYCDEYQAVYDAMTTKPSAANATAQNNFVVAAKANGYWTEFDIFYFFAQDYNTASEALLCWTDPTGDDNATNVSATAWATLQGFTGDGDLDYILSNWNAASEAVNYVLDDCSIGVYERIDQDEDREAIFSLNTNYIRMKTHASGNMSAELNGTAVTTRTSTSSLGLFVATRTANNVTTYYENGSKLGASTADASVAIPDYVLRICGNGASTNQISMMFAGGALTDQQNTDLATDFEILMVAIGTGVASLDFPLYYKDLIDSKFYKWRYNKIAA